MHKFIKNLIITVALALACAGIAYGVTYNPATYATPQPSIYKNVSAGTATTVVKSSAGVLDKITINTKGASANLLTIYDNTAGSGTVIAIVDTTTGPITLHYNVAFATGLTCKSTTGTGADYTVSYR